jgi:hypothetical protein
MYEWRAAMVVTTTCMFAYGMSRFFHFVLPFDGIAEIAIVMAVVAVSVFLGII